MRPPLLLAGLIQAAASLLAPMGAAHAEGTTGRSQASARFDVRVVVLPTVKVRNLEQPTQLRITREDVERRYVDVDGVGTPALTSNSPYGYAVSVWFDDHVVSRVVLRIDENRISADASGTTTQVAAPKMQSAPLRMGYRLFLSPRARAGTYAWPVRLAFGLGF